MNKIIFLLLLLWLPFLADSQTIRYVKANGTGDGSDWNNASDDLQAMINASANNNQVWVAEGEYQPAAGQSFKMKSGVAIYGGFTGTEATLSERTLSLQVGGGSILKGNGSRVIHNDWSVSQTAILDGFTITRGSLVGTNENTYGAGIWNENASPKILNCIIKDNQVSGMGYIAKGGGIANIGGSPTIANCVLINNKSSYQGGAIYNENATPSISNSFFIENQSTGTDGSSGGGAIYNTGMYTYSAIRNCVFYGNSAPRGAAIQNAFTSNKAHTIANCTFYGNTSPNTLNRILHSNNSTLTIVNTIIWNNSGSNAFSKQNGADPIYYNSLVQGNNFSTDGNLDASDANNAPLFFNAANIIGADGLYGTADDGLVLQSISPTINKGNGQYYTDAGGNLSTDLDLAGNVRLSGNDIDMGAYEYPQPIVITPGANNILYVDINATGTGDGNTWENAIPELADALKWANDNKANWTTASPLQIWVAKGTYKPMYSPEDGANYGLDKGSNNSFLMVNNVKLYGGFNGAETTIDQRPPFSAPLEGAVEDGTILSGDINGDDVVSGSGASLNITGNTENNHFVMLAVGKLGNVLIDGFTIQGGYNLYNGSSPNNIVVNGSPVYLGSGSGIYINATELSDKVAITNCVFKHNGGADYGGAALFVWNTESLTISNSIFAKNRSAGSNGQGGAIYNSSSIVSVINSLFIGNRADYQGGAIFANYNCTFVNCTFSENYGGTRGHVIRRSNGTMNFRNSILWNAGATANSMVSNGNTSNMKLTNCIIGNQTTDYGTDAAGSNMSLDPLFTNAADGDYTLQNGSPAINKGNNSLFPGLNAGTLDLASSPRVYNYTTGGTIDIGAYESFYSITPDLSGFINITKTYGDADFNLTAPTSNSNGTFIYSSDSPGVATVTGNTVTIVGAGTATITATQAATSNYNSGSITLELTVGKKALTVTATDQGKTYGDTFTFSGTEFTTEGLLDGDVVTSVSLISDGAAASAVVDDYDILASTAQGPKLFNYTITYVKGTLTVGKANPILSGFVNITKTYGDADFNLTVPTSNSNGTFSYSSDSPGIATVTGNTVTIVGAGTATITATQAATSNYNSGSITLELTVNPKALTITANDRSKIYGETLTLGTTAFTPTGLVNGDAVTSVSLSSPGAAATAAVNSYDITASAAQGPKLSNYDITYVKGTLTVNKSPQTISFVSPGTLTRDVGTIDLDVEASSGLPVDLTIDDEIIATVNSTLLTMTVRRLGTVIVMATQEGNHNYLPAEPVSVTIRIVNDGDAALPIRVHQAVSPNGDGINEFLQLEGIRDYPENKVTIFDKSGKVLAEIESYDNRDNVFTGQTVRDGVYYYYLDIRDGGEWKREKGFFVVKRTTN